MYSFSSPLLINIDDSACPEAWYNAETYVGGKFNAVETLWKVARSFHCIVRWEWGFTADVAFSQRPSNSRLILVRWILWCNQLGILLLSKLYTYSSRKPPTSLSSSNWWEFGGLKSSPWGPWIILDCSACGFTVQLLMCIRTLRSSHPLRSSWSLRNSGPGASDHLTSWSCSLR